MFFSSFRFWVLLRRQGSFSLVHDSDIGTGGGVGVHHGQDELEVEFVGGIGESDSVGASEGFGAVHEDECGMGIECRGHEDAGADLLRGSEGMEGYALHEDLLAVHGETGNGELGAGDEDLGEIVPEEADETVEEFGLGPGGEEGFGGRVVGVLEAAVVGVGLGLVHGGFEDGELGVIGGAEGGFDFGEFAFAGNEGLGLRFLHMVIVDVLVD
jgi:hypothetical protein